jgi:hypothetical protein
MKEMFSVDDDIFMKARGSRVPSVVVRPHGPHHFATHTESVWESTRGLIGLWIA